jgi:hypothetical protein
MNPTRLTRALRQLIRAGVVRLELWAGPVRLEQWESWEDPSDLALEVLAVSRDEQGPFRLRATDEAGATIAESQEWGGTAIDRVAIEPDPIWEQLDPNAAAGKFIGRLMGSHEAMVRELRQSSREAYAELEARRRHDRVMEERRIESVQLMEELLTQRHVRELEAQKAKRAAELEEELLGDVRKLLGPVVNTLIGRPILEEHERNALEEFIAKVKPEKLARMLAILDAAEMAAFTKMVDDIDPKRDKGAN